MRHTSKPGERQSHAYAASRQNPQGNKAVARGSDLYREGEGRIKMLFPAQTPGAGTGVAAGLNQRPTLPVGLTPVKIDGHTFAPIDYAGAADVFFQFFKNNQAVSDPIPLVRFASVANAISPNGAASVSPNIATGIPATAPIYRIEFDEIRFTNNSGGAVSFNAIIAQGRAGVAW